MPKYSSYPTLIDECLQISLPRMKKMGFIQLGAITSGSLTWKRSFSRESSISAIVNMVSKNPFVTFNYLSEGSPIEYQVQLTSLPSNLGKGNIWYFVCPKTGVRCSKLHLVGNYFYHRSAFPGSYYEKQTYSENNRWLCRQFALIKKAEEAYKQIYSKGFKESYKGRPTKRFLRLNSITRAASRISLKDEEELINGIRRKKV